MRLGKYLLAAAASMAVAPAMAAPVNPAASLSVAKSVRTGSVSANKEQLAGSGSGIIIAILAAAAVVVGIVIIADNDDDADSA